ncbi:MAG: fumarylacetoacetate hydrolase family protein, partial [Thermoanaerobaculales bacterium]
MRVATVRADDGAHAAVMAERNGQAVWADIAGAAEALLGDERCPTTVDGLLRRDGPGLETPRRVLEALRRDWPPHLRAWAPEGVRLAPPISAPGAFLDFYAFEQHVRTAGAKRGLEVPPEWYEFPSYYRSNHRSFLGHGDEVWFPAGEDRMDFELEVGAILGAPLRHCTAVQAEAAIAGFCLLNDWSARAIQRKVMNVGLGPSKAKDFGTSLGPWLVTPDEVGGFEDVELSARVNGETWSRSSPAAMHWRWGELLAYAAEDARFEPGDVFGSGTLGGGCGLEQDR